MRAKREKRLSIKGIASHMTKNFAMTIGRLGAVLAATASLFIATPSQAQGDLLVAPTRVILDGRRGTEVILSNIGSEEATYRIELVLRRMAPDGTLVDVETVDANDKESAALEMIRYAPRRITLPPGQPQAVRLAARAGPDLPEGEYRAHLSFRAIPQAKKVTEAVQETARGISFQLTPIYAITIPVIVRHGRLEAQVAIHNPKVVQGAKGSELHLNLSRLGESSTYGELRVIPQGSSKPIYMVRGVAIYSELQNRSLNLPLSPEQAAAMKGPMRFEYRAMPENGGDLIASVNAVVG